MGTHASGPPELSWLAGRGRLMENPIQAQPGQDGDGRGHLLAGGQQMQGGVGSVPDDHQLQVGQSSGAGGTASGGPSS